MISFGSFALLSPLWLCALPVIAACAFYVGTRAGGARAWERAVDPHLLAALAQRGAVLTGLAGRNIAVIVAAAIIAIALARPALEQNDAAAFRNLDATLIVADLSDATADRERLEQVRNAARMIATSAGTRQVALIVYAGDAYLANALTTDADTLGATIFALQADTVPDQGDRADRALSLARRTLRDANVVAGDVVLVTAGAAIDDAMQREATDLNKAGYRLHTVAVAPAKKTAIDVARSAELARLATTGGGLMSQGDDLDGLTHDLGARPVERLASSDYALLVWNDFGRFLLVIAAAATLLLFRRSAA
jgi:Ca-activated chloride channel family protein